MFGDGWHNLSGYRVYISAGQVVRGMLGKGRDQRPAWLYRYNPGSVYGPLAYLCLWMPSGPVSGGAQ